MRKVTVVLLLILLAAFVMAACGTPAEAPVEQAEEAVQEAEQEVEEAAEEVVEEAEQAVEEVEEAAEEVVEEAEEAVEETVEEVEEVAEEAVEEATPEPEEAAEEMEEGADLSGETITFYHFGDLSGPYAAITSPLINGMQDSVDAINEQGGIRGATIEVQFQDTGGSVDEAVAAYDRFTSEDDNPLIMFTYGSPEVEALASRFAEDMVPTLSAGLSAAAFYGPDSGYIFGLGPIYTDQFGYFLDWLTANWADVKPASAGDEIKLAYLSWPGAFGQGALSEESRAYAESLGVEIVSEEQFDLSPTADATTAILNAQAAGANVIWTNTLAFGPAALMNGLGALGLKDEFLLSGVNWAMDVATYAFVSDPALAAGMYSPFPYLWWNDTDHPGIQYAQGLYDANERGPGDHNVGYLMIAGGVDVARQAIEKAIDEVGFENLSGEAIHDMLADQGPYEGLEGVMKLDYSNGSRSPHVSQLRQIQGGPDAFNVIQDWTETPDLRPGGGE
jgi:branched-chain amino acid transport system substrate-binding protein